MIRLIVAISSTLMWCLSAGFALPTFDANEELSQIDNMLENELKLSNEQQQQLKTLKQQLHGRRDALQSQLKVINAQINQQIQNTLRNDRKLDALLRQKKQLLGTMLNNKKVYHQQYFNMLSPEQKIKFAQKIKKITTSKNTPISSNNH